MRFNSGFRAAALAGALMLLPSVAPAQVAGAGGFSGGGIGGAPALPGIGAGAYAPGQGPVGASGWYGGTWRGYQNVIGPFWGGGFGGGFGGGGGNYAAGGSANVYNYNHYDNRRRDGGFYGGGGVFYGDDGYSRVYVARPSYDARDYDDGYHRSPTGYAPVTVYRPSQHIFYLPDNNRRASRKGSRHQAQY
jgi:hypothetical protein